MAVWYPCKEIRTRMIRTFKDIENLPFFRTLVVLGEHVSPNHVSIVGFAGTLLCALFIVLGMHGAASAFAVVHLICDGLDGHLARKYNKSSQLGFLMDHVMDRLSDIILFPLLGYMLEVVVPGLLVGMVCLFSSYVGVLNKAIGGQQDKSGLFAKTFRYQLLIIMLWVFCFYPELSTQIYSYFCYGALVIGGLTIASRMRGLFKSLV